MKKEKYSYKYFKEGMPEWKRIKDPFTSRIFYRPISFFLASLAAKMKISANTISYFSAVIAILSCVLLAIPSYEANIVGAIFVNIWLLLDCTDGNIARSVKSQPFGGFADSVSSYILVAFLSTSLGISTFLNGGLFFKPQQTIIIVILGILGSTSDTLMRLIYQKYKNSESELVEQGKLKKEIEKRVDKNQTNSFIVRLESDFGIGGILPILVLIGTICHMQDLVVICCFVYYFGSILLIIAKYMRMAIRKTAQIEKGE